MYQQPQPPWGTTPPPAAPGGSAIAVTTKYFWLTFVFALFKPYLAINGQRVAAGWGRTVVPVPPGQHHVHVHVPYWLPQRVGTAETFVPVQPGQVVEVEYRAPSIGWLPGSIGPAPQRYRGMAASIALIALPLVALLCVCGSFGVIGLIGSSQDVKPISLPPMPSFEPPSLPPLPSYEPFDPDPGSSPSRTTGSSSDPTLRSTSARTLVGPSWAAGDKTYTMALGDFPFAFRTPPTWGCLPGKVDIKDAKAYVCIDEGDPFDSSAPAPDRGKRLQILLRPCPAPCGTAERTKLSTQWFDDGAKAKTKDAFTSYVETARDDKGRYALDMSHFFPSTGTAKWQVAVGVYSQPASKAVVQKIVNDVLTQAG